MFGGWEGWSGESRSSGFPRDFTLKAGRVNVARQLIGNSALEWGGLVVSDQQ